MGVIPSHSNHHTWCPGFSFCILPRTFECKGDTGVKIPCRRWCNLFMFSELCGCSPQQQDPSVRFQRVTLCPNISAGCFRIPTGPIWPKVNGMQSSPTAGSLAQLQTDQIPHPPFPVLTRVAVTDSREVLLYQVSTPLPKCPPIPAVSSCTFSLLPPHLIHLPLSLLTLSVPTKYILFHFPWEIFVSSLEPSSLRNLSGSVDCGQIFTYLTNNIDIQIHTIIVFLGPGYFTQGDYFLVACICLQTSCFFFFF